MYGQRNDELSLDHVYHLSSVPEHIILCFYNYYLNFLDTPPRLIEVLPR